MRRWSMAVMVGVLGHGAGCGGREFVRAGYEAQPLDPDEDDWVTRGGPRLVAPSAPRGGVFRNTYYDFPKDEGKDKSATVFDGACRPIAKVSQAFHDQVCLQGSGKLSTGETVSFERRGCECASICPKSGQNICFSKLDPKLFPSGRGARGTAITPLRTVAVDDALIPMGAALFVPEYVGLAMPDGSKHDGCFVAEDRGSRVKGAHIDVFTGDPSQTALWNRQVPSNAGVHVEIGSARCAHLTTQPSSGAPKP